MATQLTKRAIAATMAVSVFLLIAGSQAQVVAPLSEIKATVVDQSGARIPGSEVVFKADSKTIVSRMGSDGAATITLPSGEYVVSVSAIGFLKTNLPDFQVIAPAPNGINAVLKIDPDFCKNNACICSPCVGSQETPTITSELPNVIEDQPSPIPSVQPATKTRKTRSRQCLYLWKCSAS
jgi:hypothetical protein